MQKRYPFKFLDAYTRDDNDIFFGREEEVDALYEMVFQADLLLVFGASGTGKTSLIQCGLASRFQSHDWLALNIRRGSNLNVSFEKALREAGGDAQSVADTPADTPPDNLDWLDEDWTAENPNTPAPTQNLSPLARSLKAIYLRHFKPLYLIFDQFEELYILGSKAEQDRFIETVREILLVEQPVKIILSIREEYLGHLYEFEREVPQLLRKKLRVEPMHLDKVKTVITRVGALPQGNIRLQAGEEAAIATGIFDKIKGKEKTLAIELPYLQVFLDKLYLQTTGDDSRQADALFTLAALKKMGDIGDVLRDFLDEQVLQTAQKLEQQPETIWRILSPFVTLEGTKEPLSEQEICERLPDIKPALIAVALEAFSKSRILRYTEQEQRYEIKHDSLAKQVHAKRSDEEIAILEVQRLIKSQSVLKPEAREFFTEKQLLFIEPYLDKFTPGAQELDWIAQSRTKVQTEKKAAEAAIERRRALITAVVAGALVLAAVVAAVFAFQQSKKASNAIEQAEQKTRAAEVSDSLAQVQQRAAAESDSLAQIKTADANSAAANADVKTKEAARAAKSAVEALLEQGREDILRLRYDYAFDKMKKAAALAASFGPEGRAVQDSLAYQVMETGFIYYYSKKPGRAQEAFNLAAGLLGKPALSAKPDFEAQLTRLDAAAYAFIRARYFPVMIPLKGGTYQMQDSIETKVSDFQMAETETTVWQYNLFCLNNGRDITQRIGPDGKTLSDEKFQPSWGWIGNNPVVYVNWYDAVEYANWLSREMNGVSAYEINPGEKDSLNIRDWDNFRWTVTLRKNARGYRLPTEAEWEYAARGGAERKAFIYSGSDQIDEVAWYGENSGNRTQAVRSKKFNGAKLYDMSGNLWEWCFDWSGDLPAETPWGAKSGSYRVLRGGSWYYSAGRCLPAFRDGTYPDDRNYGYGFRLVFVP